MSSQLDPDDGRDAPTPHAPKSADLDEENSNPPKESSRQADEHRTVAAEPQLPVARLLDDPGLQLDEGPAPRRSMSSLWEPDVAPEEPSLYAPKRVRDAASGKPSMELKSRIQQLIQEPESSARSPTPPSTADEGVIADRPHFQHLFVPAAPAHASRRLDMETLWPIWPIGLLFAVTRKNESARILSGLPWWHRVLGTGLPWRSIAGINGA